MTETEAAWLSGLLEGEGSFMAWDLKRGDRAVRVQMGSTDRDVLDRVAVVTGVGRVNPVPPQRNKLGSKPMWIWLVAAKADVRELTLRVLPWLGERRTDQARAVLEATANIIIQPEGVCANGHRIEGANRKWNGRSHVCRTCVNARRRQPSSQTR